MLHLQRWQKPLTAFSLYRFAAAVSILLAAMVTTTTTTTNSHLTVTISL